jgi:hypothetical protein
MASAWSVILLTAAAPPAAHQLCQVPARILRLPGPVHRHLVGRNLHKPTAPRCGLALAPQQAAEGHAGLKAH